MTLLSLNETVSSLSASHTSIVLLHWNLVRSRHSGCTVDILTWQKCWILQKPVIPASESADKGASPASVLIKEALAASVFLHLRNKLYYR